MKMKSHNINSLSQTNPVYRNLEMRRMKLSYDETFIQSPPVLHTSILQNHSVFSDLIYRSWHQPRRKAKHVASCNRAISALQMRMVLWSSAASVVLPKRGR